MDNDMLKLLYDLPREEQTVKTGVPISGIRTKSYRCGEFLELECYPIACMPMAAKREAKRRATSTAQARVNAKNTRDRIRRLVETNFTEQDISMCLTYDYGAYSWYGNDELWDAYREAGIPVNDEDAKKVVMNFLRRVKRRDAKAKVETKYVYVNESKGREDPNDPHPRPKHYHHHLILHTSLTRDEIEELWGYGYTNADRLDMREGAAGLCRYLTKDMKEGRSWGHSRNMGEPTVTVSDRRISRRRSEVLARGIMADAKEIFGKVYPDYELIEQPQVRFSEWMPGAYISARLRKKSVRGKNGNVRKNPVRDTQTVLNGNTGKKSGKSACKRRV